MPPKQPKKGKGKKVTVTDPTSAPAPAPAAPPNPEVQAVLDAHIANVGSEHFPGGYFPIPYTLTSPDAESFPQLPPLREPLEAALFGRSFWGVAPPSRPKTPQPPFVGCVGKIGQPFCTNLVAGWG